ncbi:DUF4349 domain-containing protein [Mesobacillus foraminis]|uniref:DUF4349 domain-containing protein n=1 Tax=Mesobacillus foraminis TaxID=279826 RepID=UPI001BE87B00|nr:DUF4349 domain-containing protein [Mesobacillus foraminis]MBT2756185.1 DUF4349 domain-containing protein [Mesobacillus foraminis]
MKLKWFFPVFILLLSIAACSSNSEGSDKSSSGGKGPEQTESETLNKKDIAFSEQEERVEKAEDTDGKKSGDTSPESSGRKVIYNADLQLKVNNYTEVQGKLEKKAISYGGYIVQSQTSTFEEEQLSGTMVFRIPQKNFQSFLHDAEGTAEEIAHRNVSGQDVTEEFVDLESRLRSKKAVEARLLSFMDEAEKTEDLLKISADLAAVQEEIEQLAGRKNFLQNQTDYSTVTVSLEETNILVPNVDQASDLNTWQKVKKQLAVNINFLLALVSGIIVLIAGNLPILILIGMVLLTIWIFLRKKKRMNHLPPQEKKY